jgi:hypothetical protein
MPAGTGAVESRSPTRFRPAVHDRAAYCGRSTTFEARSEGDHARIPELWSRDPSRIQDHNLLEDRLFPEAARMAVFQLLACGVEGFDDVLAY